MLEERARSSGLTMAEWVRDVLLAAPVDGGPESGEVVLAEVLALRTLFLNLQFWQALGLVHFKAAILGLPDVDRVLGHSILPSYVLRCTACLHLLQRSDDLRPPCACSCSYPLLKPKSYLRMRGYRGAGQLPKLQIFSRSRSRRVRKSRVVETNRSLSRGSVRSVLHADRSRRRTTYLHDSKADRYFGERELFLLASPKL